MDLDALRARLEAAMPDARVRVVADLTRAGEVAAAATECGADRLVIARAGRQDRAPSVQTEARSAYIDPLGVVVLELAEASGRHVAVERATLLLAGAAAKARAFAGSRPEHARPQFSLGMDRRAFLRMSAPEQRAVPSTPARCGADHGCRRCVEACPTAAITWYGGRVHVDKGRCTSCGICASACPAGSIELPGWSDAELEAQVTSLADRSIADLAPRGALFVCRPNAASLRKRVDRGTADATGWLPVVVPCVGMLSVSLLLRSLAAGLDAVGVIPCGAACGPEQARIARERISFARELLVLLGLDRDRILLCPIEDGSAWDLRASASTTAWLPVAPRDLAPPRRAADAVMALAHAYGAPADVEMPDARSPLATVSIDPSCTGCASCADACPTGALVTDRGDGDAVISFDPTLCGGCGLCAPRCPEAAIHIRQGIDLRALTGGRGALHRDTTPRCERCDAPIAPAAMLRRLSALLGDGNADLVSTIGRYCASCRLLGASRTEVN